MRALAYFGPGKVSVVKKPDPRIEHPQDVVLRVTRAAICGSDLHTNPASNDIASGMYGYSQTTGGRLEVRLRRVRQGLDLAAGALALWAFLGAIDDR